jgi:hypothetical protein
MIFLSEEETPLEPELLSPLREGEVASGTGVEVVVITLATVDPLRVSNEVMVFTTGVWVVEGASVVLLPALVVAASLLDEVEEVEEEEEEEEDDVVESAEVVGSADEVVGVEEVEEVVDSLEVVGSAEVEEDEDDDEVVGVDSAELDEEVSLGRFRTSETPPLWAATAVNSRAWTKNERLERRMMNKTREYDQSQDVSRKSKSQRISRNEKGVQANWKHINHARPDWVTLVSD